MNINWLQGHFPERDSATSSRPNGGHHPLPGAHASEAANATEQIPASKAKEGAAPDGVPPEQHIQGHMPQEQTAYAGEAVAAEMQAPESLLDGTAGETAARPALNGQVSQEE